MSELRIHLFGYPRAEVADEPIAIARRKSLALLAYIAVAGSHHSRDALATLLWPEHDSAKSYAFLRNALWVLNQTPVSKWLIATRHMVGLRHDDSLWVDTCEFRQRLDPCRDHPHPSAALCPEGAARLQEAVNMADPPFLAGFEIDESWAFEEWKFSESDALHRELAAALERLSDFYSGENRLGAALDCAQRLLAARPLDESAYRRLMWLCARTGNRATALGHYDTCRQVLRDELALVPSRETETLAEEIRAGAVESSPVHRPASTVPVLLPSFRTPLVGRESEVSDLVRLLERPEGRLVTITGTGGSGKTRLAVEVAARSADRFSDGVVFVPLAAVDRPNLAPAAVIEALGDPFAHSARDHTRVAPDALTELVGYMDRRNALVVLDNVEHLVRDLRWIQRLLDDAPSLRVMATSRQELDLPGEVVYPVDGLPCATPEPAVSAVGHCPAVSLFLQIARQSDARFSPSDDDMQCIAEICRLLDGIPLAIELAASWVRTLSCRAIALEMARGLDFLKTQKSLVPRRHRSLRSAFEGSWTLLDREGRRVFRRLSVFREGFSLDAALRIGEADLPALAHLAGKSLVRRIESDRYVMLEIVRQYAVERLRANPDEDLRTRRRMAEYYMTLLAAEEPRLKASDQRAALQEIAASRANVYAAWRQALSLGRFDLVESAAMGLFLFCDMTTRHDDGAELFSEATEVLQSCQDATSPAIGGYLMGCHAWFLYFRDPTLSRRLFGEALQALADLPPSRERYFIQVLAAYANAVQDREAIAPLQAARTFFEEYAMDWELAATEEAIAGVLLETDPVRAGEAARRSVELRHARSDYWGEALARYTLAKHAAVINDLATAETEFRESARLRQALDIDPLGVLLCFLQLGHIECRRKRPERALEHYHAARSIAAGLGHRLSVGWALEFTAAALFDLARYGEAESEARAALEIYETHSSPEDRARCRDLVQRIDLALRLSES